MLFVCENNGYAEFTSREEHSNVNHVSAFAAPYGMPAKTIDGNDLRAVTRLPAERHRRAATRSGPYLLECMTYRMAGHYVGDAQHLSLEGRACRDAGEMPDRALASAIFSSRA